MGQVINKGEFTKILSDKKEISSTKAAEMVNDVLGTIQDELVKGNKINFTGFGQFEVADRAAREGRNPGTGEKIHIEASKYPKFSAGKTLKDAVNK